MLSGRPSSDCNSRSLVLIVVAVVSCLSSVGDPLVLLHVPSVPSHGERRLHEILWQRISSGGVAPSNLMIEMSVPTDSEDGGKFVAVRGTARNNGIQANGHSDGGTEQSYAVSDPESTAGV